MRLYHVTVLRIEEETRGINMFEQAEQVSEARGKKERDTLYKVERNKEKTPKMMM